MAAASDTPSIAIVAVDEQVGARLESALGQAWPTLRVSGLPGAEHAISTHSVRVILIGSAEAGADLIRRLSRQHPTVAPIVWNAGLSSESVARLLLAGASDVLNMAMSDAELHARVSRAIGSSAGQRAESTSVGDLSVDTFRGEATWRGQRIPLTNRERDVLDVLVQEEGKTLRREVIYQRVWGHAMPAGDRNVDVNIKRLRQKLSAATDDCVTVETISRVGYRLQVLQETPQGATAT